MLRNQGKSVTESAEKGAELQRLNLSYRIDDTAIQPRDIKNDMDKFIEQQENFNRALIDRLEQQQEYINIRLEERDAKLMQTLNALHEQKKIEIERNKKKWWKFWG